MLIPILFLAAAGLSAQVNEELNFYRTLSDGRQAEEMLPRYLHRIAGERFAERDKRVRATTDWPAYRQGVREQILRSIGGLPQRTPLNARVVGTIARDGYRIEKIIFESQPRFYVTANLYVPTSGTAPYPGILFPLGHESGAKAHDAWQHVLSNLARRGFVLLAWDPIGQGERVQLWDEDFRTSKLGASTTEHSMAGIQSILLGDTLARFTIWDGIRALDYLASRPEVDPKRLGITGNSGGGTHSAYIAALDDRIQAAAPSCYLTNWRKLLETIGPQDAEQCFPGFLSAGYDHPDFVLAMAPKPYLILSAIRDFFSIGGARETFAETRRVYDSLGVADKMSMFEADDGHGYTKPRREAAYRWFTRILKGIEDPSGEVETVQSTEKELNCTTTGQVLTSLGGETIYSLNVARMQSFPRNGTVADLKRLTGFIERPTPVGVQFGTSGRMRKLIYETEPGILIPAVLFEAEGAGKHPGVVIIHGRGKAASRDLINRYVRAGSTVLSIDARGWGETSAPTTGGGGPRYFGDYKNAMTSILLGKPLVAMRAEDVSGGVGLLAGLPQVDSSKITVHGVEMGTVAALIATVLDHRVAGATLEGGIESYEAVLRHKIHRGVFEQVIPGALRYFDLPAIARMAAPRKVEIVRPVDPLGAPVEPVRARQALRLTDIQVVGTHNSYHVGLASSEMALLRKVNPRAADSLDYRLPSIEAQLASGVRQFELDVFGDSKGGLFADPAALKKIEQAGLPTDPPFDPLGLFRKPGFKVLHVQDLDYRSNCQPFTNCLAIIRKWSKAHPKHLPIFILVENKDGRPRPEYLEPEKVTAATFDALDAEIRSVFSSSELITPDDVRGIHKTLEEAVITGGWPTLEASRGKVIFLLDQERVTPLYNAGRPSLQGRVLFTNSKPGSSDAAFVKVNNPASEAIPILVRKGYLVRTMTDDGSRGSRNGVTLRRDAALASGAQMLSTNYPFAHRAPDTDFSVSFESGIARCNPVTRPVGCSTDALAEN